jgi:hypothetical protein
LLQVVAPGSLSIPEAAAGYTAVASARPRRDKPNNESE